MADEPLGTGTRNDAAPPHQQLDEENPSSKEHPLSEVDLLGHLARKDKVYRNLYSDWTEVLDRIEELVQKLNKKEKINNDVRNWLIAEFELRILKSVQDFPTHSLNQRQAIYHHQATMLRSLVALLQEAQEENAENFITSERYAKAAAALSQATSNAEKKRKTSEEEPRKY